MGIDMSFGKTLFGVPIVGIRDVSSSFARNISDE
jgi:hypothetical protein